MHDSLPIFDVIADIKTQLQASNTLILQAPPGAGKSTIVPLELLDEEWMQGLKILMLEPRRLAARAVARRMAALRNEALADTVGYRVRFDSRVGPDTRIEVVTEGILTRMIQDDNALEGVGMVIFDEFHERSLHADLGLLLVRQAQEVLREDLRILIMSATINTENISKTLGDAPVIASEGREHPVETHYFPAAPDARIAGSVAAAVRRALRQESGDVLAFLPGTADIRRTMEALENLETDTLVLPLYGDLPQDEQEQAIRPDPQGRRKVVLATSIAETSLTIEGIRVVIDSGFSRVPRFDPRSGFTRLETVEVTLDAADQRAGRAGRLGPGVCYRLWEEGKTRHFQPHRKPEILTADLAPLVLELAEWGVQDIFALDWLTPPPRGAVLQARELLFQLEALDADHKITDRGREMLRIKAHPRLAHILVEGKALGFTGLAADIAALLEARDPLPREAGADLRLRIEALRRWRAKEPVNADRKALRQIDRIAQIWRRQNGRSKKPERPSPDTIGRLVAAAYPERIAKQMERHGERYRLRNSRHALLQPFDPLINEEWLAVAHMDAGLREGRIFLAAPVDPESLGPMIERHTIVEWDHRQGVLMAVEADRIGVLTVRDQAISDIPDERAISLLGNVVREDPSLLNWSQEVENWQARVLSLRKWRPDENWPDVSREAILQQSEDLLGPFIAKFRRKDAFRRLDLLPILTGLLPWPLPQQLEGLAPTHLHVPSGSRIRLEYFTDGSPPVLAVRLQEMFGQLETPRVNAGRTEVMVHLLSPAHRPIQITQDLKNFWNNTYAEVRKDLRGRYSKHHWPENPLTAEAVRGAKKRKQ